MFNDNESTLWLARGTIPNRTCFQTILLLFYCHLEVALKFLDIGRCSLGQVRGLPLLSPSFFIFRNFSFHAPALYLSSSSHQWLGISLSFPLYFTLPTVSLLSPLSQLLPSLFLILAGQMPKTAFYAFIGIPPSKVERERSVKEERRNADRKKFRQFCTFLAHQGFPYHFFGITGNEISKTVLCTGST